MFGYVVANKDALTEEDLKRYRGFYCGICAVLKRKYGTAGRAVLTYDMAFLAVLLTSLLETETSSRESICPAHPKTKQLFLENDIIEYCADMNLLLAYYNCLDDWQDEKNIVKRAEAKMLKPYTEDLHKKYPKQAKAIEEGLKELDRLERSQDPLTEKCADAFGGILGTVFCYGDAQWFNDLFETGKTLGRFIYIMDAYEDLEKDAKKNAFNPLLSIRETPGFEETASGMLTMLMDECTQAFERLPIVENLPILRNILYSGVWTRYNAVQSRRKTKQTEGKESQK